MINVDSFLKKGKQHFICEDYIINSDDRDTMPYIILSDGCSSSENTDIGSRVLVRSALNILDEKLLYRFPDAELLVPNYWEFGRRIIEKAIGVIDSLRIQRTSLDATLIIAYVYKESVYVLIYGDGYIYFKNDDCDEINYVGIKYDKNAPYYLNYLMNKDRDLAYSKSQDKEFVTVIKGICRIDTDDYIEDLYKTDLLNNDIFSYKIPIHSLDFIGVSSDGIESFMDNKGNSSNPKNIIKDFTSFKNTKGKFVKRRLNKAISEYEMLNFNHLDDISFGCFHFGE